MRSVTIKEAKARLNELIDAATLGEQVVLMRGSKHVAALVPITEAQLELTTPLTDAQAERFWQQIAADRAGATTVFESAREAVEFLSAPAPRRPARGAAAKPRTRKKPARKTRR